MLGIPPWRFLELRKRVQRVSLALFGNCLAANLGSDMRHNLLFAISPRNRHPFRDEGLLNDASLTAAYNVSRGGCLATLVAKNIIKRARSGTVADVR